jgi:hypothetical protein
VVCDRWRCVVFGVSLGIMDGASGAAGGSYESIATATGTGSSGTITFSSIPSTYKHLQIRYIAKDSNAADGQVSLTMIFNSDTGANYAYHELRGTGTTAFGDGAASQNNISLRSSCFRETSSTQTMGVAILDLQNYSNTSQNKTIRYFSGVDTNNGAAGQRISLGSGLWINTNAITTISITTVTNFSTSSVFSLYGIQG